MKIKTAWFESIRIAVLFAFVIQLPANARDYSAALNACKTAAYKQTGLEAEVHQFTRQFETYVRTQVPYATVIASGYGAYKTLEARQISIRFNNTLLTFGQYFSSIIVRF